MEISPYLQNQRVVPRKRSSLGKMFYLVFLLSLGLNLYFILLDSQEPNSMAESLDDPPASVELAGLEGSSPVPVNGEAELPGAEKQPVAVGIKQVSFAPPDSWSGKEIRALHLNIRGSLSHTVCRALSSEADCEFLSAYISRLLAWFFDIRTGIWKGDSLDLVYEKRAGAERFRVLKLVYRSLHFQKTFHANYYRIADSGPGSYFDGKGREIPKRIADRYAPIKNYMEITSLPGDFRKGPVGHEGTDFKAEVGTPIYASFAGRVTRTNWNLRSNGYCVELDHPAKGVKTLYLHLSRVRVRPGQFVKQGENIAASGNTGRTFAPHLHFEIKNRGNRKIIYNPFEFKSIETYNRKIPHAQWDNYQKTVSRYGSFLRKS
ncbi:MAG: M23 family metallopeptidase [Nitrospinaceae bacterium]